MNSKGFWKPPGYGKSREIPIPVWEISFPGNRPISGKCLQKSANFWEIGKFLGKIGKFLESLGKIGKCLRNFWKKIGEFLEKSAKFLGNRQISGKCLKVEIRFPEATFRDTGNDFPGEEVRDTGQKPPGHNPIKDLNTAPKHQTHQSTTRSESINALQSFLREGRVVGQCWEKLTPKGPTAKMLSLQSFLREGRVVGLCWAN